MATVVTAVAIVVSALGAVLLYFQTRKGVAQREALTVIRDQIGDRDWIEDDKGWRELRYELSLDGNGQPRSNFDLPQSLVPYATNADVHQIGPDFIKRRSLIVRRLNRYEMIAVGIRTGCIDESIMKLWWAGPMVSEFLTHRFFIASARQNRAKVFKEFHWLAYKFADDESQQTIEMSLGAPHETHPDAKAIIRGFEALLRHWKPFAFIAFLLLAFLIGLIF